MSWNTVFLFRFDSENGAEYNIYIKKEDYGGEVIQRHIGRAPVLKKKKNGPIYATSLELYAECLVDGEFSVLYTSDPQEYLVEVDRNGQDVWTGFVCPELYSEPDIAPPYDVQIVAVDGLSELKIQKFEALGSVSLCYLLGTLLNATGNGLMYFATSLNQQYVYDNYRLISGTYINIDHLAGKTYYEVLTMVLNSIGATITKHIGAWMITRERDIYGLLNSALKLNCYAAVAGTILNQSFYLDDTCQSYGQMGRAILWPVGNLERTVIPAKNEVFVRIPIVLLSPLLDHELANSSLWPADSSTLFRNPGFIVGNNLTSGCGTITQTMSFLFVDSGFNVKVKAYACNTNGGGGRRGWVRFYLKYEYSGTVLYGSSQGWFNNTNYLDTFDTGLISIIPPPDSQGEYSIFIPHLSDANAGAMTLVIDGYNTSVDYADVEIIKEKGYLDDLKLDNNARTSDEEIEIVGGRVLDRGLEHVDYYHNYWMWNVTGGAIKKFRSDIYIGPSSSPRECSSFIALERAWMSSVPRINLVGVLNLPSNKRLPLFIYNINTEGVPFFARTFYWIDTYEWDLYKDELKISAISSIQTQTITVESEVVKPYYDNE